VREASNEYGEGHDTPDESNALRDAAFRACYLRDVDTLLRFSTRCAGRADAEDLVAETFVRAYRSLPTAVMETDHDARAWLFRVLRNLVISASRRRSTAQRKQPLLAVQTDQAGTDAADPELEAVLLALPERQRTVVSLRFVSDLDVATTASVMDLTEEAVRALTHRALRTLRGKLGGSAIGLQGKAAP
jgi:RNA polymerase sigma-70 factor, ECF subfamily